LPFLLNHNFQRLASGSASRNMVTMPLSASITLAKELGSLGN